MRVQSLIILPVLLIGGCGELPDEVGAAKGLVKAAQMVPGCYEKRTMINDVYLLDGDAYMAQALENNVRNQPEQVGRICFRSGGQAKAFAQLVSGDVGADCVKGQIAFSGDDFSASVSCPDRQGEPFDLNVSGTMTKTSLRVNMVVEAEMRGVGRVRKDSTTTLECVEDCGTY